MSFSKFCQFTQLQTDIDNLLLILIMKKKKKRVEIADITWSLDDLNDADSEFMFRFNKADVRELQTALQIDNRFQLSNGMIIPGLEALCMTLHRFAYPVRLNSIVKLFNRPIECVSRCINDMVHMLYDRFKVLFVFDHRRLTSAKLQSFCNAINRRSPATRTFGFIDGKNVYTHSNIKV